MSYTTVFPNDQYGLNGRHMVTGTNVVSATLFPLIGVNINMISSQKILLMILFSFLAV